MYSEKQITKKQWMMLMLVLVAVSLSGIFFGQIVNKSANNVVRGLAATDCQVHNHVNYPAFDRYIGLNAYLGHLEADLLLLGYSLPVSGANGYWGDETTAAVAKFKADNGLSGDSNSFSLSDWKVLQSKLNTYLSSLPSCTPLPTNPALVYCRDNNIAIEFGDSHQCVKTVQTFMKFAMDGRKDYIAMAQAIIVSWTHRLNKLGFLTLKPKGM